jgi:hypothetical protein
MAVAVPGAVAYDGETVACFSGEPLMRPTHVLCVFALVALPLTGCDGSALLRPDLGDIGGNSGFTNIQTSVNPSTATATPGQSLTLSVTSTPSADRFSWTATGGQLSSTSGNPVTWTAPSSPGTYNVNVTVYSGTLSAPTSFRFTVR